MRQAGPPDGAETYAAPQAAPALAASPCPGWWWGRERYVTGGEEQAVVHPLSYAEKEAHLQGVDWTTTSTVADHIEMHMFTYAQILYSGGLVTQST